MHWFDAALYCKSKGGNLVEIDSEEESTALVAEITRRGYTDRKMNFWIGLTDLRYEGDWRLASSGLKPSYVNWHDGEPNNAYNNEDCAWIRIGTYKDWKGTWADINCEQQYFTMREYITTNTDKYTSYTYSMQGQDKPGASHLQRSEPS